MNKYRFAKIYLALLLGVAILVLAVGVTIFAIHLSSAFSYMKAYSNVKHEPFQINTKELSTEIQTAADIVRNFVGRKEAFAFEDNLAAMKTRSHLSLPIAYSAGLDHYGIEALQQYMLLWNAGSRELKTELLNKFETLINMLEEAAKSQLTKMESQSVPNAPVKTAAALPPSPVKISDALHIYEQEALLAKDLATLEQVASFLHEGVARYTPSTTAAETGGAAAMQLTALIRLLRDELENYERITRNWVQQPAVNQTQPESTPTQKILFLKDFLRRLQICHSLVKAEIESGWRIDARLAEASKALNQYEESKAVRLERLQGQILNQFKEGLIMIVGAIVAALVLLIIRDFLRAIIDTATNTEMTVTVLDKIRTGNNE